MVQIGQKFERFLETYRRPDVSKWSGQDLHDATGGIVTRSYVSSLRKGRIENPGFEKLRAIAKAMDFPPELWFEDVEDLVASTFDRPLMPFGQRAVSTPPVLEEEEVASEDARA